MRSPLTSPHFEQKVADNDLLLVMVTTVVGLNMLELATSPVHIENL